MSDSEEKIREAIKPITDLLDDWDDCLVEESVNAILRHFQQEQEKAVDELRKIHKIQRDCGSLEDQYMLGLYNGLEMALSIAEDREPVFEPGKKKEPTYTQSEVDRLIREAREREAYWSLANLELIKGGTFNEGMVYKNQLDRLKVISEELSKQEEGNK